MVATLSLRASRQQAQDAMIYGLAKMDPTEFAAMGDLGKFAQRRCLAALRNAQKKANPWAYPE